MYHIFFIHSSVDGHLRCFHVLATVNSAAVNIGVHVSFGIRVFIFFRYMPRSAFFLFVSTTALSMELSMCQLCKYLSFCIFCQHFKFSTSKTKHNAHPNQSLPFLDFLISLNSANIFVVTQTENFSQTLLCLSVIDVLNIY